MALKDLLWACPLCGLEGGLARAGKVTVCRGCGARFRRGRGARVIARAPRGDPVELHAAEWADRLGPVRFGSESAAEAPALRREARALARFEVAQTPVRHEREFLGWAEHLGPPSPGTLVLTPDRVEFEPDEGEARVWPLERLTAVQSSSGSLALKARGEPLVSFRFPEASTRFWEELLEEALRRFYRSRGRGEIVEFQPRIVTA